MASALADRLERPGGASVEKAPVNPWAAPPPSSDGKPAMRGMLTVSTVDLVDAGEVAAAVAEGVAKDGGGTGIGEMARTRVGQAPPWQRLEWKHVLAAWHECGGDVDALAKALSGTDGADSRIGM